MTTESSTTAEPAVTITEEPTRLDPALEIGHAGNEAHALTAPTKPVAGEPLQPALEPHEAAASADLNQWTPAQIQLLKDTVCRGATDDELRLFLYVCQRRRLDPFTKQIHAIKRRQKVDGRWKEVITHQTSIDGFRLIADRTGQYRGQRPFEWCGRDGKWVDVWLDDAPPRAARATVLREGWQPVIAVALFDEYVQTVDEYKKQEDPARPGEFVDVKTGNEIPNAMWQQRPAGQLAKCAEALAFRMGFPEELSGLYTFDEMGQADNPSKGTQRVDDPAAAADDVPTCPVCHRGMWDNRSRKRKGGSWSSAPDFRCKDKQCPGEIQDATKPANPTQPAAPSTAKSSAGTDGPQSSGTTPPNGNAQASTSPTAATPIASTAPQSSGDSPPLGTNDSSNSAATNTITRGTVIDWATHPAIKSLQGKTIATLKWTTLEYFREKPAGLPPGWLEAIKKEIALREDTGDEHDVSDMDDAARRDAMDGDGYR
jgi:phage recombination protein Bet